MQTIERVTPRQLEVAAAVIREDGADRAAAALGISSSTVKNLLSDAYARAGVRTLLGLALAAGWIALPGDPLPAQARTRPELLEAIAALSRIRAHVDVALDELVTAAE